MKEIWKSQVNETNFDSAFQASKTQHDEELIIWVHSLKKENKDLMAKVNSCETRLNHVSESYISQFHSNSVSKPGYDTRDKDLALVVDHVLYSVPVLPSKLIGISTFDFNT